MIANINGLHLQYVKQIGVCNCEIAIIFHTNHKYSSIQEIAEILTEAGITIGNYCFKGKLKWGIPDEDTRLSNNTELETSILCVIPEHLRNSFQVHCFEP